VKTLFLTAWLQVFLVALNTWQIANGKWLGALLVGFGISLVWTLNIKRIAFAGWKDRLVYSTGAMCGTGTGILAANLFY
jgi:hypothetical protein